METPDSTLTDDPSLVSESVVPFTPRTEVSLLLRDVPIPDRYGVEG